jgi:hypothetical protein
MHLVTIEGSYSKLPLSLPSERQGGSRDKVSSVSHSFKRLPCHLSNVLLQVLYSHCNNAAFRVVNKTSTSHSKQCHPSLLGFIHTHTQVTRVVHTHSHTHTHKNTHTQTHTHNHMLVLTSGQAFNSFYLYSPQCHTLCNIPLIQERDRDYIFKSPSVELVCSNSEGVLHNWLTPQPLVLNYLPVKFWHLANCQLFGVHR